MTISFTFNIGEYCAEYVYSMDQDVFEIEVSGKTVKLYRVASPGPLRSQCDGVLLHILWAFPPDEFRGAFSSTVSR